MLISYVCCNIGLKFCIFNRTVVFCVFWKQHGSISLKTPYSMSIVIMSLSICVLNLCFRLISWMWIGGRSWRGNGEGVDLLRKYFWWHRIEAKSDTVFCHFGFNTVRFFGVMRKFWNSQLLYGTMTSYMPKDQEHFDLSNHHPFINDYELKKSKKKKNLKLTNTVI